MHNVTKICRGLSILDQCNPEGIRTDVDMIDVDIAVAATEEQARQLEELDWSKIAARSWTFVID